MHTTFESRLPLSHLGLVFDNGALANSVDIVDATEHGVKYVYFFKQENA